MTSKDDPAGDAARDTTAVLAGLVTAEAAALLKVPAEQGVVLAGYASLLPGFLQLWAKTRSERRMNVASAAVESVAAEYDVDLSDLAKDDNAQECFLGMYYDMMQAIDDAAAGPLGHLAMTYVAERRPPDAFFRAFGRVMREFDGDELRELEELLTLCVSRIGNGASAYSDSEIVATASGDALGGRLMVGGARTGNWEELMPATSGVRLLSMLRHHGLFVQATESPGSWDGEPVIARVWKNDAQRALLHMTKGRVSTVS